MYVGSDLAVLEVLHVSHAVDHFLRLLAEWVDHVILLQVGFQRLSIWMRLELMNQLLDCLFADVIVLLESRMGQCLDPEIYFTATGFPARSAVIVRMIEELSRVGACSVLAFIIQVRLQYNSVRCNKRLIRFAV